MYYPTDDISKLFEDSGMGKRGTTVEGWAICNGNNATPDLQERFIVGARQDQTKYKLGETGGEETHKLTENEMPSHSHSTPVDRYNIVDAASTFGTVERLFQKQNTNYLETNKTGGGSAHENRPPYYALFYIMKL